MSVTMRTKSQNKNEVISIEEKLDNDEINLDDLDNLF
jgi:hypothetical protein